MQPGHGDVRLGEQPAPGCCLHVAEGKRTRKKPAAGDVVETPAQ